MSKFRGIKWNNARFGPKIQVRRSIDLAELGDFGNITDDPHDLPTRGALHRDWTDSAVTPIDGSKSGTRLYTDLRYVDSNVVDTQDMGLIGDTASTHRVWSSTGAITDVVTSAPSTLYNPSGSSSSSGSFDITSLTTPDTTYAPQDSDGDDITWGPQQWLWNDDGTSVYVTTGQLSNFAKYDLTTPYDISTASLDFSDSFFEIGGSTSAYNRTGYGLAFNHDGTELYSPDSVSNNNSYFIRRWTLSTPYTITESQYTTQPKSSFASTTEGNSFRSLIYSETGVDFGAWAFGSGSNAGGFQYISIEGEDEYIFFKKDYMLCVATVPTAGDVSSFSWTNNPELTAFDARTLTWYTDLDDAGSNPHIKNFNFNSDGTKLYGSFYYDSGDTSVTDYWARQRSGFIEITLGTAYDLSSITDNTTNVKVVEFDALPEGGTLGAILSSPPFITPDGDKILLAYYQSASQMSTWNLSSRSSWHQWDLSSGSSSTASGSSSTTSTATYSGPALAADYALDFSSTNNYLSVDQDDVSGWFTNSSGWSVELWFKHSTNGSYHTNDGLVNQHGNIVLFSSGNSKLTWAGYANSTSSYSVQSSANITDTDWHHLHIGYDGTTVRMFLDGSLEDSTVTAVYGDNADSDFIIGAREGGMTAGVITSYFNGYIADVHITSGGTTSVRTSAFDVDDVYSPTKNDETVLLVYGTSSGIENDTDTTVTEKGSGSAIGYSSAQPWAGYGTSDVTFTQKYTWASNQGQYLQMPRDLVWNGDGTMVYYVSGGAWSNCKIVGASLSTAYDISTITDIDSQVYDAADDFSSLGSNSWENETNLTAVSFNPEGTKMWVVGNSYDTMIQFNLSTAWDITTASANYKVSSIDPANSGMISGSSYGDSSWNHTGWSSTNQSALYLGNFYGMEWHSDGYKFTHTDLDTGAEAITYTVSTAYDISTITSKDDGKAIPYADTDGDGLADASDVYGLAFGVSGRWNHNGTERYTLHQKFDTANYDGSSSGSGNGLNGWDVVLVKSTASTAYDPSTLSYSSQCDLTDLTSTSTGPTGFKPGGLAFSPNGKKLYVIQWKEEDDSGSFSTTAIHEFDVNG